MNKILFSLLALFAFSQLFSQKKVAVTTFYVDKHIDFSALGGGTSMVASIASLAEDPNFDLTSVLDNFHDVFFNEYAKQFPFELLPEATVVENEEYQNFEAFFGETSDEDRGKLRQRYLTAEGYKPMSEYILAGKNRNDKRMLEIFGDQVDGIMFVSMEYSFVRKAMGLGAGIQAYVRIKLWNKEAKKVFKINEFATSKKTVPLVAGIPVMDLEKILPMCEDASAQIIEDLKKRLKKVASKSAKKL